MAAAAVRCDAEEAAFVDEVSDKRTALYRKRLAQEGEGKPD